MNGVPGNPTISQLLDQLNLQGAALLPQALASGQAEEFGARAEGLAERWREKEIAGALDAEDCYALNAGTVHFRALMGDPIGRAFVTDLLDAVMSGRVWRLFRRIFGDEVAFPLRACSVRWHRPPFEKTPVPMHQDVGFIGSQFTVLNCWLTFTPAGADAAGLEIAPIKLASELPKLGDPRRAANINFWSIEIDPAAAGDRLPTDGRLRPVMDPGDALLFDQFTPHRTYVTDEMTKPRISVELRGCRAADLDERYAFPDKLVLKELDGVLSRTWVPRVGIAPVQSVI